MNPGVINTIYEIENIWCYLFGLGCLARSSKGTVHGYKKCHRASSSHITFSMASKHHRYLGLPSGRLSGFEVDSNTVELFLESV